jgi:hypothetical protein
MNHNEMQEIATANNLGFIQFEEKIALNTGRPMEVGYVWVNGHRELFCKRSMDRDFYLCNDYAKLRMGCEGR